MEGKILIIRHSEKEGPGTIEHFFKHYGFELQIIGLDRGDTFPAKLDNISAVIILGGHMNVYEEQFLPFFNEEERLIRKVIIEEIPLLGICLGAQLIAKTCNAMVTKSPEREIGWYRVTLNSEGQKDMLFQGLSKNLHVFQWHEDTFDIPPSGVLLAQSNTCKNQAFRVGNSVYGLQFHIEVTENMIKEWAEDAPANIDVKRLLNTTSKLKKEFEQQANQIFINFKGLIESAFRIKRIMKLFIDDDKRSKNKRLLWWDIKNRTFSTLKYSENLVFAVG